MSPQHRRDIRPGACLPRPCTLAMALTAAAHCAHAADVPAADSPAAQATAGTAAAAASAATPAPAIQQVQVGASRSAQREQEITTAIIVPQAELLRQGDQTLSDALKRLPGISITGIPGQGGAISMRGLGNGYTQIMLNGEPVPAGFTLDTLSPDLVERVEIQRSSTAERSNQAVAGTINIILKKAQKAGQRALSATVARHASAYSPSATVQLSDRDGGFGYSLAATLARTHDYLAYTDVERAEEGDDGALTMARRTQGSEATRNDALTVTPRLNWTLTNGDTLSWQGFANLRQMRKLNRSDETALSGPSSAYPRNYYHFDADFTTLRSDLQWQHQLDGGARFEMRLGASGNRRLAHFDFYGFDAAGALLSRHVVDSGPSERTITFTGTYRRPLGQGHALAMGWDASRARRDEDRNETIYAASGAQTGANNADYSANVHRLAWFAQDEWELSKQFALYAGLRHERLQTASRALASNAPDALDVHAAVWSPSLQMRYTLPGRHVLRLALARTYKAPPLSKLVPRRYVMDNNNSPNNPDEQGNPALRPELAWGLDATYEHYLGDGALVSLGAYWRRIRDVTQMRLFHDGAAWVTEPFNNGSASVHGLEFEAKLPLRRLLAWAPALDVRANLARNWSRVANVPGPDNRLEEQTPFTANLGADYRLPDSAWTVGGTYTVRTGAVVQQSLRLRLHTAAARELDLYALCRLDAKTLLRLSGANLLHRTSTEWQAYRGADAEGGAADSLRERLTRTPTRATVRLQLERQF